MPLIEHGLEALLNLGAHCVDLVAQSDSVGGTKTLFWDEAPWVGSTSRMGSSAVRTAFGSFISSSCRPVKLALRSRLRSFHCMRLLSGPAVSGGDFAWPLAGWHQDVLPCQESEVGRLRALWASVRPPGPAPSPATAGISGARPHAEGSSTL